MRRVLALLVLALVGAGLYGALGPANAVTVNGTSISSREFHAELTAISGNANLQCYLQALAGTSLGAGEGVDSITAKAAAAWASLRVEGLGIDQYVRDELHHTPTSAELATAENSFVGELAQAAAENSLSCPGTATAALAAMPASLRRDMIEEQASSTYLLTTLGSAIPLTTSSLEAYYRAHQADFETICLAVAVVEPTKVAAFDKARYEGMSADNLVKNFSIDTETGAHGSIGCYGPTSSDFSIAQNYAKGLKVGEFTTSPNYISFGSGTSALFVSPTKYEVTPFAKAASKVLSDVQTINAEAASRVRAAILAHDQVSVDKSLGRWTLTSVGPVVTTHAPANANVPASFLTAATLSSASTASQG